ncbi:MAG: hypothetical protein KKH88_00795 [Nanoarchaeota archaeon]|nr:hypothetical protein [Nanoarchaeota archaeon]MBU1445052.1 hypothetical protein [Nanoarchaeota archaeon]MBU2420609.1 hypothetical protein [Nanoarchaeota archaeon]MBU2475179.1 hypothetical protein [Nanoarchaeota archaeon]MBU3940453.1 hypothetical protein [Nanoarchaeota archaeon]
MAFDYIATGLVFFPVIIWSIILSVLEMIFLHGDIHRRWLIDSLHVFPFTFLFIFINLNAEYVINYFNWDVSFPIHYIYLFVGLIAFIKIYGAVTFGMLREKIHFARVFFHTIIIALLIIVAPYLWKLIAPLVAHLTPFP